MTDIIDEKMAILRGDDTPKLSKDEKSQLADGYFKLFYGLTAANWARGENINLGAAWYSAISQIKAMIGAKDKGNPSAMYMAQLHAAHSTKWAQIMMTSPDKDSHLEISPDKIGTWNTKAAKQIGDAMNIINASIEKHKKPTPHQTVQKQPAANDKFAAAQQRLMQKQIVLRIIEQNNQNQRAA